MNFRHMNILSVCNKKIDSEICEMRFIKAEEIGTERKECAAWYASLELHEKTGIVEFQKRQVC